jgi:hypothetical protein
MIPKPGLAPRQKSTEETKGRTEDKSLLRVFHLEFIAKRAPERFPDEGMNVVPVPSLLSFVSVKPTPQRPVNHFLWQVGQ